MPLRRASSSRGIAKWTTPSPCCKSTWRVHMVLLVCIDTAWETLEHALGPHRALPVCRTLVGVRTHVAWCGVVDLECVRLRIGGLRGMAELLLVRVEKTRGLAVCRRVPPSRRVPPFAVGGLAVCRRSPCAAVRRKRAAASRPPPTLVCCRRPLGQGKGRGAPPGSCRVSSRRSVGKTRLVAARRAARAPMRPG